MATTVVGQANAPLLDQQAGAIATSIPKTTLSSNTFVFYAGFNGTMNSNNPATSNDQVINPAIQ